MGLFSELAASDFVEAIVALFIITDAFGNVPIFIALTRQMPPAMRLRAFRTATSVAFGLLLVFAFLGQTVLTIFGISISTFMVAGGVLLFILAMRILVSGGWEEREISAESMGAVPLGFPLLSGPGAITVTIVTLQTAGLIVTVVVVVVNFVVTWLILRNIEPIHRVLGKTGSAVISRLMAVFLAAIGIGFVAEGVKAIFGL